ncbi:MAG: PC4/YdbC family ssDNA-binding protein [Clostridiales bacterium]|nr:PC4/YdbC family ssDNA-binding protein [Clostridiales bacterium]
MADITFEVLEKLGILSESPTGWTKELRLMNWNNRGPRYDLREWAPGDRKASRGITLSLREMRSLQELLVETELPEPQDEEEIVTEEMLEEAAGKSDYNNEGSAKKKAG